MRVNPDGSPPTIIHADEFPDLPLPRTADVRDLADTWVHRLGHPYREDQEIHIDVDAGSAIDALGEAIRGWWRGAGKRRVESDTPWFVRLPWSRWTEYLHTRARDDSSVLDQMVEIARSLDIIILVEHRVSVVAEYVVELELPDVPVSARQEMVRRFHPDGIWRPATEAEAENVVVRIGGHDRVARAVHWETWVGGASGIEVYKTWPRRPGQASAMRRIDACVKKKIRIRLMSDGSQVVVGEASPH